MNIQAQTQHIDNAALHFKPVALDGWNSRGTATLSEQILPFSIQVVQDPEELADAVRIRHDAYARHLPELAQKLMQAEAADFAPGTIVFLARAKLDGSPMGTARIQTNDFAPLPLETSVELPARFQGRRLAEVNRLGVQNGHIGRAVKIALVKALFEYCAANGFEFATLVARHPIDRQYSQLMFEDVFPEIGMIPMGHCANLPHRVMSFEIATGEERWSAANHPLLGYFRHTRHPDINIEAPITGPMLEQLCVQRAQQVEPALRWA